MNERQNSSTYARLLIFYTTRLQSGFSSLFNDIFQYIYILFSVLKKIEYNLKVDLASCVLCKASRSNVELRKPKTKSSDVDRASLLPFVCIFEGKLRALLCSLLTISVSPLGLTYAHDKSTRYFHPSPTTKTSQKGHFTLCCC